jgi:putative ABC transport system permease protein
MNDLTLITSNVWRKPLRTILLILSIAVAFLLFFALNGFLDSFERASKANGADQRLAVSNKINFTQPLPISYVDRVKALEGVADVTHYAWFGGFYREQRNQVFTFGIEPESYLRIYGKDVVLPPEQAQAFIADRSGALIGGDFADLLIEEGVATSREDLLGKQFPLNSNIFTNATSGQKTWILNVRGIFEPGSAGGPSQAAFLHWEYFDETKTFSRDTTGTMTVVPADPAQMDSLADAIDETFANSRAETDAQPEDAFSRSFLQQAGDIGFIIRTVTLAAFFAILMIVATTLILAIRERTREIGVLKTLGFSSHRVLIMVLAEALFIAALGAGLGYGLTQGMFTLAANAGGPFPAPSLSTNITLLGVGMAAALGLVTGAIPALNALNLRIVEALGRK